MFFSVTPVVDYRFPINHKISQGYLNVDYGWQQTRIDCTDVFFKGYTEEIDFAQVIRELLTDPTPRHRGNFAVMLSDKNSCIITHDVNRSFPLYWYENLMVTNLVSDEHYVQIYADRYITLNNSFKSAETFFDCYGRIDTDLISLEDCTSELKKLLITKFQNTQTRNLPLKIFLSGGVDTLMMYAILKDQCAEFEFVNYEHFDYDIFTYKNKSAIKKNYWAYSQIHHWHEPSILITGSVGDEFFFRGPNTIAVWAAWHKINVLELLTNPTDYHYSYFNKPSNQEVFKSAWTAQEQIRKLYPTEHDLIKQILNINVNDHQYWHINNTLTMTLYKDIEITKLILRLPKDELIKQILDAGINKDLIKMFNPRLSDLLTTNKNYNNLAVMSGYDQT